MRITPTETEILQYIADGKCQIDIAKIRGTHEKSIHKRMELIRAKLQAESTVHAVAVALRAGIIK